MRSSSFLVSAALLIGSAIDVLGGANPVSVKVTLRGKKYDVVGATCVEDVQKSVEEQAGLAKEQQSVLFKGSLLKPELELEKAGVSDGDTVNIVPSKKPKTASAAGEKAFAVGAGGDGSEVAAGAGEAAAAAGGSDPFGGALSGLGGFGGMGAGGVPPGLPPGVTPEMYQKMMKEMMNSDMMEEVLGNPEKMEQARQAILDNPTLKQAMAQLPGFADMIDSPEKWRENMEMALEMFKAQKAMMQQQGGADEDDVAVDVDDLDDD